METELDGSLCEPSLITHTLIKARLQGSAPGDFTDLKGGSGIAVPHPALLHMKQVCGSCPPTLGLFGLSSQEEEEEHHKLQTWGPCHVAGPMS